MACLTPGVLAETRELARARRVCRDQLAHLGDPVGGAPVVLHRRGSARVGVHSPLEASARDEPRQHLGAVPDHGRTRRKDLLAQGVSAKSLRHPRFRRSSYGWYAPAGDASDAPMTRIADALALLPDDGVLGGWAAAHALGVRELDGRCMVTGRLLSVPVVVPVSCRIRNRQGIDVRRGHLDDSERTAVDGLPVTSAARTAYDLARGRGAEAALVDVDALLRQGLVSVEEVTARVNDAPGARGIVQARQVVALADASTRSRPESRLRYVWVVEAGLPRPLVNPFVYADGGWLLGLPDLLDEETGLVGEYDGAGHREARQHAADNAREEAFEHHGCTVVRAMALDLGSRRQALVHRLVTGYGRARATRSRRRWSLTP